MKKILALVCLLCFLPLSSLAAYTPTANDALIISQLTNRINSIIEKKWEKNRATYVKKLTDAGKKIKKNEKYVYIIDKVVKNITPSLSDIPSSISDFFKEIDPVVTPTTATGTTTFPINTSTSTSTTSTTQTSHNWMDISEYQISRDNIYAERTTSGQGFLVSCQNFSDKWDSFYFKELEIYIKMAEKNNNTLLLQLIKTDFTGLEKYFKEKCKMELKSITSKVTVKTSVYDEPSMKKVYYDYKNDYVNYLENFYYWKINGASWLEVYCTNIMDKWSYFDFPRLKMIKQALTTDGKKDMLELFEDMETKIRKVYKEYCKVTELAS